MTGKPLRTTQRLLSVATAIAWLVSANHAVATELAELTAAIEAYNGHESIELPLPSDKELRQLAAGQVVKIRRRMPIANSSGEQADRIRIVGYRVIEQPRLLVWLAALDVGTQHSKALTEHLIASDNVGGSVWYQYLKLPWPVKNRHWVIHNTKNTALAAATGGTVWEHAWRLETGGRDIAMQLLADGQVAGLTPADGEKAIYLPINRGGWTVFALDRHRALVAAHVTTELGGWIPDSLVASTVSRQLQSMLSALEQRAASIHLTYTSSSYPIFTGDGKLITPDMATAAQSGATELR